MNNSGKFSHPLSLALLTLLAIGCSQDPTQNRPSNGADNDHVSTDTPRDVVKQLMDNIVSGRPEAIADQFAGAPELKQQVVCMYQAAALKYKFKQAVLNAYGESAGQDLGRYVEHQMVDFDAPSFFRQLDARPIVYEGDLAFIPDVDSNGWTRFVRRDGQWKIDADAIEYTVLSELFSDEAKRHGDVLREVLQMIGQQGTTVESIREKLAKAMPLPPEKADAFTETILNPNPDIVEEIVREERTIEDQTTGPTAPSDSAPSSNHE